MKNEILDVYFYDKTEDDLLKFAVIIARSDGKWVLCKHRERDTYEVPGGHREPGESIEETARRELHEETGALDYEIKPICAYSVERDTGESFGMLYYAEIKAFEGELRSEIEKTFLMEKLPENWTYPLIQPKLLEEAQRRGILPGTILIREAGPQDAAALFAYSKLVGGETDNLSYGEEGLYPTIEAWGNRLESIKASDRQIFLLALQDGQIVGTANYMGFSRKRFSHRGEVGITVRKSMWGNHIGSRLLEQIINFAKNNVGSEIISLEVRSDNERAIALYKKYGFEKIGHFKGFFKVNGEAVDFDLMNLYL